MKVCSVCQNSKPLLSFNRKGDGWQSKCRECQREWYKTYYDDSHNEKARLSDKRRGDRIEVKSLFERLKAVPCMDCGISYPSYVMDFDHRDPSEKEFGLATSGATYALSRIKLEIEKCDIVCANCHRERTHKQRLD